MKDDLYVMFTFHDEKICDRCYERGAYDFLGEYLCNTCFSQEIEEAKDDDV